MISRLALLCFLAAAARADFCSQSGTFAQRTSTGSQAITGLTCTPKVVLFFSNNLTAAGARAGAGYIFGYGVSSSARGVMGFSSIDNVVTDADVYTRDNSKVIGALDAVTSTAAALAIADLTSLDSDGFTLNWTIADANARIINYLVLGGSELSNVFTGTFNDANATGNQAITGFGFAPSFVAIQHVAAGTVIPQVNGIFTNPSIGFMNSTNQGESAGQNRAGVSAGLSQSYQRTNSVTAAINNGVATILKEAAFVSFDSDGYTINWTTNTATGANVWLDFGLKGIQSTVGALNAPTANGVQSITGMVTPAALWAISFNFAAGTGLVSNNRVSIGWCTGISGTVAQSGVWSGGRSLANPTIENQVLNTSHLLVQETEGASATPTLNASVTCNRALPDGIELNWDATDATARQVIYVAFAGIKPVVPAIAVVAQ